MQWTKGDWKIDVKQKEKELDLYKIKDPRLYRAVVNEDIISGQKQLKNLSQTIVYGNNYTGPINVNVLILPGMSKAGITHM